MGIISDFIELPIISKFSWPYTLNDQAIFYNPHFLLARIIYFYVAKVFFVIRTQKSFFFDRTITFVANTNL